MKRSSALPMITTLPLLGLALLLGDALAQQTSLKEQLIGTWTFVSSTTKLPDGGPAWGSNPKGLVIFTENGRYSSQLVRSDRPKFAANSRAKGTPEENKAAVLGGIASFGTYTVDEANKTFTVRFEGSSYPNLEGTTQTRPFTITGDELKVTNPSPSLGGPASEITYKRAK
jgi:Lipocalin-like domain